MKIIYEVQKVKIMGSKITYGNSQNGHEIFLSEADKTCKMG